MQTHQIHYPLASVLVNRQDDWYDVMRNYFPQANKRAIRQDYNNLVGGDYCWLDSTGRHFVVQGSLS